MRKGTRFLKHFHLPFRSRSPAQPPPSSTNDHGQSRAKKTAWAALKTSIELLKESADAFGPLKSAVGGISRCIEIFERAAKSRKDYETLAIELDTICKDLSGYLSGPMPPTMTSSIESLAKGIEQEIEFVLEKEQRNRLERAVEAMDDPEDVMQCYSRIQRLLERLVRNANMASWRIVDEQATTNRLRSLPDSPAAKYQSAESANLRGEGCTPNTRVNVLETLRGWAYNDQSEKIYWLNGMAGTGKTTIADSLCALLVDTSTLAASFFCSRQLPTCNDVNRILPSISYQLALFSPPFRHALSRILEQNPEAHNQSLPKQFKQLIVEPLQQVENTISNNLVVVVDALDECVDQNGVDRILETLISHAPNLPIKFFITSRPESKIRDRMIQRDGEQTRSVLHLHDLERSIVREDIKTYLKIKLERTDLATSDMERLVEQSGVLFIYAATLVRYIGADNFSRSTDRLRLVLNTSASLSSKKDRAIDELYSTILHAALNDAELEEHEKDNMKDVLCTVLCAQEPLTVDQIAGLLGFDSEGAVRPALRPLLSVLHVSQISELVTTLHQSFPDYMFAQARSKEFYCSQPQHNALLTERCFNLIGTPNPPFNICGLESSHLPDEKVSGLAEKIKNAISPELLYACQYFGAHLELAEPSERLFNALFEFLSVRLLLWMEVLNLSQCMHIGARGLYRIQAWTQRASCPVDTQQLARDAAGFVTMFSSNPVSRSTPHIYISALPFWPEHRPVSKQYLPKMQGLPKATGTGMRIRESAPLAICVAPRLLFSVAYSSDGARIVSGCGDNTIRVWDAHTGRMIGEPLEGHTGRVYSVAYSSDDARIVSGSEDNTIRVWNAHTGQMIGEPLRGHTSGVKSVAYSSDDTRIVSGSEDETIRVWDALTSKMIGKPLEGHSGGVNSAAYSSDDVRIVSGSYDGTIRVWDVHTGEMVGKPLEGHTSAVVSVAYSSDDAHIVSGSEDNTIRIWDAHTGEMIGEPLEGHTDAVWSVAFSSDNTRIVSGSRDKTIRVWDVYTGNMIGEQLEGHTSAVRSVAYSSDGERIISGSFDRTIRVWDAHASRMIAEPLEGHTGRVNSVAYSPDDARVVSGSEDNTIRVWDVRTGRMVGKPLEGHTGAVESVAYSSDGAHIVSGSADKTIRMWDALTGQMVGEPLKGHTGVVYSVAYSSDGARVISGSGDKTIRVWNAHTGKMVGEPLKGHTDWVRSVAYSSDGACIVSGSDDHTIRVWDARTGRMIGEPLEGHFGAVDSVASSPDGAHIVSGSEDNTIRVWDVRTSQMVGEPLKGHTGAVYSVEYSSDGAHIVSGSVDKTIRVWDAFTGQMVGEPLKGHASWVRSVAYSSDGARIISGSEDNTIRVWDAYTGAPSGGHTGAAKSIVSSSNGTRIISESHDMSNDLCNTWLLDQDGYMLVNGSDLVMWVPPDVRGVLMRPRNTAIISRQGSVTVDFTSAHIGDSWTQCYQPA